MRWLSFIIVLVVATVLDTGNLLNVLAIGGWTIRPGILITLLVYYAITSRSHEAISCSFIIGLATDLSTGLLGPHTICYGVAGVLLNSAAHTLSMRRATHKAAVVFFVFMLTEIGAYWLSILKTHEIRGNIYSILFFTGLYSAVLSPLVWSILSSLSGWTETTHTKTHRIYH